MHLLPGVVVTGTGHDWGRQAIREGIGIVATAHRAVASRGPRGIAELLAAGAGRERYLPWTAGLEIACQWCHLTTLHPTTYS